ncbi:MAG: EpsG family protein [Paludibacteraceae bacterium]|nr:EpsG family protein [Paludibacteraceae bacterium]
MGYSGPYITMILLLIGLSVMQLSLRWSDRVQKFFQLLAMAVFLLFYGTRAYVQTDVTIYLPLFEDIPRFGDGFLKFFFTERSYEPGFVFYMSLFKQLSTNYFFFSFCNTLVDLLLLNCIFRRYLPRKLYAFFLLTFVVYAGMNMEINILRNAKSILIFFLSVPYIERRDFKHFALYLLLGISFHWSSLFFLPFYWILNQPIGSKKYWIIFASSVVFYFVAPLVVNNVVWLVSQTGGILGERATAYLKEYTYVQTKSLSVGDVERVVFAFLLGLSFNRLREHTPHYQLLFNMYACYFFVAMASHGMLVLYDRICPLFILSCWILYPLLLTASKQLVALFYFLLFSASGLGRIHIMTNNEPCSYYDSWLLTDKYMSFDERVEIYEESDARIREENEEKRKEAEKDEE